MSTLDQFEQRTADEEQQELGFPPPPPPPTYAEVAWSPEDVQELKPDWPIEKCERYLQRHAKNIQETMVQAGWQVLELFLDEFEQTEQENEEFEADRRNVGNLYPEEEEQQ